MRKREGNFKYRLAAMVLTIAMPLTMLVGCADSDGNVDTSTGTTSVGSEVNIGASYPTEETRVGESTTETTPAGDDTTETSNPPATEPDVSVPDVTLPSDPAAMKPGVEDSTETSQPTEPTVADPAITEPVVTEPLPKDEKEPDKTEGHTHSYVKTVEKPTCTARGYTLNKCACGDSYKDDYVAAKGHSYGNYKSNGDATCTKDGTKTAKCKTCGAKSTVTDPGTAKGHSYSSSVVKATCSAQGYTLHKCSRCGDSYKDNYTAAGQHSYKVTAVREPSMTIEGCTTYTCESCGNSYQADFVPVIPQEEFERMVAAATAKYINQFRVQQGSTEAEILPGLTNVAQYRAVQLQTNFRHSITDLREALAYYQYGEWVDMTEYGYDGYYTANAKEAIVDGGGGVSDADALGYRFAEVLYYSPGHWAYVGSSKYPYIGVGATWSLNGWCICVLQTEINYG